MPIDDFITVPDELLHIAAAAEDYFIGQGFDVAIEGRELGFPFTPALVCRRGHECTIVEVFSTFDESHVSRWVRYCKSQREDTRYCAIIRTQAAIDARTMKYAIDNRIGLGLHDDQQLMIVRPAPDLAVHVALPEVRDLAAPLRPILAPAFQKITDGDWRDGLGDAYLEVEQRAREYLRQGIDSGRVLTTTAGKKPARVTSAAANRMTLGQLAGAYSRIQKQNQKDSLIGATLALINQARVGLAHRRRDRGVEADLRNQLGPTIHAVIACLEEIVR